MLIALFTALAVIIFGGGESPYILPDAEKLIKKNIEDKDRKKEVLAYMKDYKKEWKALKKTEKKQTKSAAKLNKKRDADPKELANIFQQSRDQRNVLYDNLIKSRLAVQKLISDEEWDTIIKKALDEKPKTTKKIDKEEAKARFKQNKKIQSIADEIESVFSDEKTREKAAEYLKDFENDLTNQLLNIQNFTYEDQEVLRDHNASEDELNSVTQNLENYRNEVHSSYLNLREKLVELSTEENWPKLSKALGKLF